MAPKLTARRNDLGIDVSGMLPPAAEGTCGLAEHHVPVWERAVPYLHVRNNDSHTLYAYGLARALVALHPDADPEIVLPAVLLHDIGWSQLPADEVLQGIAPGSSRPDLVVRHEKEGAALAREILEDLGYERESVDRIVEIVDGHDTRTEALSIDDALMKDADKLWRITPHGVDTVMDWFGLPRADALRLIESRVHDHLFTDAARTMARCLAGIGSIDISPQLADLAPASTAGE